MGRFDGGVAVGTSTYCGIGGGGAYGMAGIIGGGYAGGHIGIHAGGGAGVST